MPIESTTAQAPYAPDNASREISKGEGISRPYINDRLNSRIDSALPEGQWEVIWRSDLAKGIQPTFLLRANDRIVVQGRDLWQLFTTKGEPITVEPMVGSGIVLDADNELAYLPAENGVFTALRLTDGSRAFVLPLLFGPEFDRVFFARRDDRIIVASVEQPVDLHEVELPEYSLVEVHGLGNPASVDDLKFLASPQLIASIKRESNVLVAAMHDDRLTYAVPGSIEVADLNLERLSRFEGDFTPLALSLDDYGSAYLLVETPEVDHLRRHSLWMISAEAEKGSETDLAISLPVTPHPPIVGPNGIVYVLIEDRILAIDSDGIILWNEYAGGTIAGGVVLREDRLLVSAGGTLQAFTPDGDREVVFFMEADPFRTHPVVTSEGSILVATDNHLICLSIHKPQP